jgi:hypothetical protein
VAIRNVVTRGYGAGASIAFVVTRGYTIGPSTGPSTAIRKEWVLVPSRDRRIRVEGRSRYTHITSRDRHKKVGDNE